MFDDVSVLTEESNLWDDIVAEMGMEDLVSFALEQATVIENVLAYLHWGKSDLDESPMLSHSMIHDILVGFCL